ncbi:hypothetical protein LSTR_LSTR004228 [Laodelphax striatellus]|uniref:Uncharacterized protein n=1 Tax=Laodelphax striatellus TaxID=195883 RepID=A0A482XCL8_LAOST|nr:hypothetical protein LSTR_LSTR004228 [Laodelphax striatellus]
MQAIKKKVNGYSTQQIVDCIYENLKGDISLNKLEKAVSNILKDAEICGLVNKVGGRYSIKPNENINALFIQLLASKCRLEGMKKRKSRPKIREESRNQGKPSRKPRSRSGSESRKRKKIMKTSRAKKFKCSPKKGEPYFEEDIFDPKNWWYLDYKLVSK